MSRPNLNLRNDKYLTEMMIGYRNPDMSYGHLALPEVLAEDPSGLFPILSKADWLRDDAQPRGRSSESQGSGFDITQGTYVTLPYSHKHDIDIDDMEDTDDPIVLESLAAQFNADKIALKEEVLFGTAAFTASTWTGVGSATDQVGVLAGAGSNQFIQWQLSGSTPSKDVQVVANTIQTQTGYKPNTIFAGAKIDYTLVNNADVRDCVKYDRGALGIAPEELAKYFRVKNYVVCGATKNTAAEGATASMSKINDTSLLLCYIDDAATSLPALKIRPTALARIYWKNLANGINGRRVEKFYMPEIKSWRVSNDVQVQYKRSALDLGTLFTSVVA